MTHAPLDAKYSVHDRLRKLLPPSDDWHCPCHCVAPEIGVFRRTRGDRPRCGGDVRAGALFLVAALVLAAGCSGPQTRQECIEACRARGLSMDYMSCYPGNIAMGCSCSCWTP